MVKPFLREAGLTPRQTPTRIFPSLLHFFVSEHLSPPSDWSPLTLLAVTTPQACLHTPESICFSRAPRFPNTPLMGAPPCWDSAGFPPSPPQSPLTVVFSLFTSFFWLDRFIWTSLCRSRIHFGASESLPPPPPHPSITRFFLSNQMFPPPPNPIDFTDEGIALRFSLGHKNRPDPPGRPLSAAISWVVRTFSAPPFSSTPAWPTVDRRMLQLCPDHFFLPQPFPIRLLLISLSVPSFFFSSLSQVFFLLRHNLIDFSC